MAGKREFEFLKFEGTSLRERSARLTLRKVRKEGQVCVELRRVGKRIIFFCILCLSPCYSETVLFDHLEGSLHAGRYAAAEITLLRSNPWPFNDGVLFFNCLNEREDHLQDPDVCNPRFSESSNTDKSLAVVCYNGNQLVNNGNSECTEEDSGSSMEESFDRPICEDGAERYLVIPSVMVKGKLSDLLVKFIGCAQIGARVAEKEGISQGMNRIWCEWLGEKNFGDEDISTVRSHDFVVVVFHYCSNLGRRSLLENVKYLLEPSPSKEMAKIENHERKRKASSNPEDASESLITRHNSPVETSGSANNSPSRLVLDHCHGQWPTQRSSSNKKLRQELRQKQRTEADTTCEICQHRILPGKDVAALLNTKTQRLICSSRNIGGAFHLFHISCLVHWILFCESEIYKSQMDSTLSGKPKVKGSKRKSKTGAKSKASGDGIRSIETEIFSVFCPQCQGTGIATEGDDLERTTFPLSEMFKFKLAVSDARRAWMKSPEQLENCSIGFTFPFPSESEDTFQEKVVPLKMLQFYRAEI